jgi:hypothetical protein
MSTSRTHRKLPPAVFKICLTVGVLLLIDSAYLCLETYGRIYRWRPVEAVVVDSQIVNEPHLHVASDYRAHFTFRYTVGDREYVSATKSDFTTNRNSEIRFWRYAFKQGSHHVIRYNPAKVSEITTADFDLRSFREPLWIAIWGAALVLISLVVRRLT